MSPVLSIICIVIISKVFLSKVIISKVFLSKVIISFVRLSRYRTKLTRTFNSGQRLQPCLRSQPMKGALDIYKAEKRQTL
jgi:hypothetical protein